MLSNFLNRRLMTLFLALFLYKCLKNCCDRAAVQNSIASKDDVVGDSDLILSRVCSKGTKSPSEREAEKVQVMDLCLLLCRTSASTVQNLG